MKTTGSILGGYRVPILAIAILAGLVLGVPFLILVATSWTTQQFLTFPPVGFTLDWYAAFFTDKKWMNPLGLSLVIALISTAIALVFGTAGALAVARLRRLPARIMRTLFIIPIALPPVAYAIGLYGFQQMVPMIRKSLVLLVLGEALLALPYVFVLVSAAVSRLDPALRSAAATLGAKWPLILWRIELPLLWPTMAAGAIFGFNLVFDELTLSVFLLPPGQQTLPLKMLSATSDSFTPALTAASTVVSLAALVLLGVVARFTGGNRTRKPRKGVAA